MMWQQANITNSYW